MGKNMPTVGVGSTDTTWTTCTVMQADGHFCDATVPDGAPISACKRHLVAAYLYCENLIAEQAAHDQYGVSTYVIAQEMAARFRDDSIVYYARIGDLIKIGTTTIRNMVTRMQNIRADCVLATEPGSYELEHQRHRQFIHSKAAAGRELFHETPDLIAFINDLPGGPMTEPETADETTPAEVAAEDETAEQADTAEPEAPVEG